MHARIVERPEVENLHGERYPKVSPRARHAFAQAAIVRILCDYAVNRGFAGTEWRFRLPAESDATLLIPDVAYISAERLRPVPIDCREEPPIAPDIAVEVRSPSDDVRYLERKIAAYLHHDCRVVLDVDPLARTIVAHTLNGTTAFHGGERFTLRTVPGLEFNVRKRFRADRRVRKLVSVERSPITRRRPRV